MFYRSLAQAHIDTEWDDLIYALTDGNLAHWALVKGIISKESSWRPSAVGAGDSRRYIDGGPNASYGMMQVLFSTAKSMAPEITREQLLDPGTNITLGTRYLLSQLRRYSSDPAPAVAAYNAGTARKNADGQFVNSKGDTSVQTYVDDVLTYAAFYLENVPRRFRSEQEATSQEPEPYSGNSQSEDSNNAGGFFDTDIGALGGIGALGIVFVIAAIVLLRR